MAASLRQIKEYQALNELIKKYIGLNDVNNEDAKYYYEIAIKEFVLALKNNRRF